MPRYYAEHARGYDLTEELPFIEIDGERCLEGSAGSLILGCRVCGAERFRERADPNETCWTAGPCRGQVMQPIKFSEREHYHKLWLANGDTIIPVAERKAERLKLEAERPWGWQFGDKTEADYPLGYVKSAKEVA